ncbi:MAG: D-tyrosyl-tRNA(Tyr) deacylase [Bacilli bacterium]|jgi:D-tyrosyl-tRNA(Tyr) deacylase|nr:D-tyrosyl-tRNA(Tyr) deacylase [Bacilli bacterium]
MRVIIQRSKDSYVSVEEKTTGSINSGMVILVGFTSGDNDIVIDKMINKILKLRIFDDENGVMNLDITQVNGEILSISQFTLYANTKKGNRPSYIDALNGEEAIKLYELFNKKLSEYVHVETGVFGADMDVHIRNDGPVTIMMEMNKE